MDFKELFKLLLLIICMITFAIAFVFIFGELDGTHSFTRLLVCKAFGLMLGLASWRGMKFLGLLQWLDK